MHTSISFAAFLFDQLFSILIIPSPQQPIKGATPDGLAPPDVHIDPAKKTITITRNSPIESRAIAFAEAALSIINRCPSPAQALSTLISELLNIAATQPNLARWLGLGRSPLPQPAAHQTMIG